MATNNYSGYLLKFGSTIMPNKYFIEYSSTPNQRLETQAIRDQNGDLQRQTLQNYKTSITFSTRILHLNEKMNFQAIVDSAILSAGLKVQRKCKVIYWNDENNDYSTGYFYIPDIEFSLMDAGGSDILYNPITVELIEY